MNTANVCIEDIEDCIKQRFKTRGVPSQLIKKKNKEKIHITIFITISVYFFKKIDPPAKRTRKSIVLQDNNM